MTNHPHPFSLPVAWSSSPLWQVWSYNNPTKPGDFCTKLTNLIATNTSNIQKTFSSWMLLRFRTLATNHVIPYLGNKQFLDLLKCPFPEIQNLLDALGRSTPITLILKAEGPTGYEDFVTFGICLDAAATAWSIIWAVATPASSVLTSSCLSSLVSVPTTPSQPSYKG